MIELPPHLKERTRILQDGHASTGEFVLYWMHHAMRDHENPALDVARVAAATLGKPLVVWSGLAGEHPHNNDRHFTFILESAREVHSALTRDGICAAFFLPEDPSEPSPLRRLFRRAAFTVVEDFPVPPFPRWTDGLLDDASGPVVAVDGHCIVPMQLAGRRFDRAFKFRQAVGAEFDRRVGMQWPETSHRPREADGLELGEGLVDWAVPIPELVSRCRIDHSVGPVPDTPGGSAAGYGRWNRFLKEGLSGYARKRNDAGVPSPQGVSRMSAYLHYGCVSPMRLAREAAAAGGKGAEKYLDELFVWRELAHNYCYHTRGLRGLTALPDWALDTLEKHRDDPRDTYSAEAIERAGTGDELWNLAQTSLLRNGELHNNLRMTWGKKLVEWGRTPEEALAYLLDLNNRYALDGSDPNSYGGLLWCMGLFDRPFPPEKPVLGLLRPRSSAAHARRLDMEAYAQRIRTRFVRPTVAVIGAGISGLAAARTLQDNGCEVRLFDKGSRPGGRLASRADCDHGAQYFTARDPRFERWVRIWEEAGVVALWKGRLGAFENGTLTDKQGGPRRWVGTPTNNAVAGHLAADLHVVTGSTVRRVERSVSGWTVHAESESRSDFDALIVTVPQPQASSLMQASGLDQRLVPDARMHPCWTVVLRLEADHASEFDGVFVNDGPLSWIARNSSKPERPGEAVWVLQAGPKWSSAHLEDDPEAVATHLMQAGARVLGEPWPAVNDRFVHRWRYALGSADEFSGGAHYDAEHRLAFAGDWLNGGRVEGAWLSGIAAAGFLLRDQRLSAYPASQGSLFQT
ncbi:MAG: FAD-dependent oxidoreductase [Rhodothermales bacterium]|nr:FAD-dependent oxidoreductase [Rhodothermales bacterium]MBO6780763.1 FAD-dependent oxidoreductase [Rhodothermales bacterium]